MSQLSPEVTDHQTRGAAAKIKNISALFFFLVQNSGFQRNCSC